ncbi:spermatogenesis-associated protein 5-like protein 1 isoform X1 [Arapaima gigas]
MFQLAKTGAASEERSEPDAGRGCGQLWLYDVKKMGGILSLILGTWIYILIFFESEPSLSEDLTMEETCLRVLPLDPADVGTQRCRLGPGAMSSLGLKIGFPVRLSLSGGACLCTAWPRSDLAEGFLQFDAKCATQGFISLMNRNLLVSLSQIKAVTCPKGSARPH